MSVRGKIIVLVLFLECILMVTAGLLFLNEHKKHESETLNYIGTSLKNHFLRTSLETKQRYASRVAGFINSNPEIPEAFTQGDREKLAEILSKKLAVLHNEDDFFYAITFCLDDGTVFYHSATPQREGSNISHIPFAQDSFDSQRPQGGLVLSLAGLAYRFSYPIFDQGRYAGMIVFVIKATHAIGMITKNFGVDCGILIKNQYAYRFDQQPYPTIGNHILVASSGLWFTNPRFLEALPINDSHSSFRFSGQQFRIFYRLPVENYRGTVIGEIVTVLNMTEHLKSFQQSLVHAALVFVAIFIATIFVLFNGAGLFLTQVKQLQAALEDKVRQRTAALEQVNQQLSQEVLERERSQKALEELSERDMLTGLYNRRKFDAYFTTEWNAAHREQRSLSLLMIDIDHFKAYNDHYGHLAGDEALAKVAATLQKGVSRPRDFVARYGGEEFICLLPETALNAALSIAEKLRSQVQELQFIHEFSSTSHFITISIGVATACPTPTQAKEDLIELADRALYRAKEGGRNCIRCD
ncbi:MAG: diguanylate cyclase [Desulfuromonadaceae bacterium]|nr:diguanylate cyclase [Desulfuromonadaceae bacterium]